MGYCPPSAAAEVRRCPLVGMWLSPLLVQDRRIPMLDIPMEHTNTDMAVVIMGIATENQAAEDIHTRKKHLFGACKENGILSFHRVAAIKVWRLGEVRAEELITRTYIDSLYTFV
ncbi:unnamed protein product [Amoebophrya sp. A25]|nr:unnamed protein product [Amoebophrya sp. A25]|eukprot:GSA25T00026331001.1